MYGFKPRHAQGKPVQNFADGGIVHSLTGMLGMRKRTPEELRAADAKSQARNQEAATAAAGRAQAAPDTAAPAAPAKAISDYSGMLAMQRREKEQGLADGGTVKPRGFKAGGMIRGPGTGTSDSIETEKKPGTFIMPADSTQAIGPEALEELGEVDDSAAEEQGEKMPVRLSNGEFELPPEQVQALGEAVLTVMRNATHQPASGQEAPTGKGFTPHQFFAGGGTVQDEERLKRVNQIPVGSDVQAPAPTGQDSTDLSRNVNNGLNALGGMGVVASVPLRSSQAVKAAAAGSGATALPSGIPRLAGPAQAAAAPAADFVAGMGPNATTMANNIPRIGNAPTQALPAVNAALQEGAQANALSAAARTASGAGAGANAAAANQPVDATAAAPAPSTPGGAVFGFYPQLAGGQRTTYATDAKLRTGVQATGPSTFAPATPSERTIIGGGNGQRMNAAQDPRSLLTATGKNAVAGVSPPSAPSPPGAAQPGSPAASTSAANPPDMGGNLPTPQPVGTSTAIAPGVYQHGRGQYSDNASGMGMPAGFTGQPNAQNMAAADALSARSQQESMARVTAQPAVGFQPAGVTAPTVRHSGNDWQSRNDLRNAMVSATSIMNDGGKWDKHGKGVVSPERAYAAQLAGTDAQLRGAQPGVDVAAMRENAGIQREGMQQEGSTTRTGIQEQGSNARAAVSSALQRDEFGLKKEAAGFQTRAAARLENLQTRYDAEKDPAKRSELAQQLQAKDAPARYKVAAGGQQIDANGVVYRTPDRIFNEQTGVYSDGAGAAPAPQAMPKPASKAEFDALPKGARFTDPNGQVRIK